jgi:hypothetical protein
MRLKKRLIQFALFTFLLLNVSIYGGDVFENHNSDDSFQISMYDIQHEHVHGENYSESEHGEEEHCLEEIPNATFSTCQNKVYFQIYQSLPTQLRSDLAFREPSVKNQQRPPPNWIQEITLVQNVQTIRLII